jgi:hypothetical protein
MGDVGLTIKPQISGPAWWPGGASFGADFANGRYMRLGRHVPFADAISLVRGSEKYGIDGPGALSLFAPGTLARTERGALIEPAATNVVRYSQEFDNAIWQKFATSVTANAGLAPDGTLTADRITPTSASAIHRVMNLSATLSAGTAYSVLVYLKADGIRFVYVNTDAALGARIAVDLVTGGFVTGGATPSDALVSVLANGWREVRLRGVATGSSTNLWLQANSSLSSSDQTWSPDGSAGFLAWGAMVSSAKGSYVATGASEAARSADIVTLQLPAGSHNLTLTFDDNSTQALAGVSGAFVLPTPLNRPLIKRIVGMPA